MVGEERSCRRACWARIFQPTLALIWIWTFEMHMPRDPSIYDMHYAGKQQLISVCASSVRRRKARFRSLNLLFTML